jgi:hypothetical protein
MPKDLDRVWRDLEARHLGRALGCRRKPGLEQPSFKVIAK